MQLYSVFIHSFDLSQVIDFKQLTLILANWVAKQQPQKVEIKKLPFEHFTRKPLKRQL
jgi:hypothetical protein